MKIKVTILLTIAAILCLAQIDNITSMRNTASEPPYDWKIPPPLNLGVAYEKAIQGLGADTNQFHCISATCLSRLIGVGSSSESMCNTGWTFVFQNTNGAPKNVYVYFDKASTTLVRDPNDMGR